MTTTNITVFETVYTLDEAIRKVNKSHVTLSSKVERIMTTECEWSLNDWLTLIVYFEVPSGLDITDFSQSIETVYTSTSWGLL